MCIWSNQQTNTFSWSRAQGILGDQVNGPVDKDHSLGIPNGWYIFANADGKQKNDIAAIETATTLSKTSCMEFYYYFSSSVKFTFSVFVKQTNFDLWRRTSSQGNLWRLGRVTVSSVANNFNVVMKLSNIENGSIQDIFAIDDIYFTDGPCIDSSEVNQICTFSNSDLCGYQIDKVMDFQWKYYSQSSSANSPLPINDHSTDGVGSGFVFVDTTGFENKIKSATMRSIFYDPLSTTNISESSRCLEFYYYIQGNNQIELRVQTILGNNTVLPNFLWSRTYDHIGYWWKAEANVKYLTKYGFIFAAIIGKDTLTGVAAIDDIVLRNGECSR